MVMTEADVAIAVPTTAAVMVALNPAGATITALAEMTTISALAPTVTPRLAKNSRSRSTARLTLLRSVVGHTHCFTHFMQRLVLEIAEQHGQAVRFFERVHRVVQERFDVRPVFGSGIHGLKFLSGLFAKPASCFTTHDVNRPAARDVVKPRREDGARREMRRLPREFDKDGLGHFLRKFR
jgi:hypothetical protein